MNAISYSELIKCRISEWISIRSTFEIFYWKCKTIPSYFFLWHFLCKLVSAMGKLWWEFRYVLIVDTIAKHPNIHWYMSHTEHFMKFGTHTFLNDKNSQNKLTSSPWYVIIYYTHTRPIHCGPRGIPSNKWVLKFIFYQWKQYPN